jgi:predicted nicotinamide N-methyase
MTANQRQERTLHLSTGDFPLHEYRLRLAGREWSILHTKAILTPLDEVEFFREAKYLLPYGVALWPASIALGHEIAARAEEFAGTSLIELGSGTGLPGIVAASLGARVLQTDRHELAISISKRNGEHNKISTIDYRQVDWAEWSDHERYDWIIGSDILYTEEMHRHLVQIFERNLKPNGRVLISDPFRKVSIKLLEQLDQQGWQISLSKWSIGDEEDELRAIGVYELRRAN